MKKLFDIAYRAVACTPNYNQNSAARSAVARAAAELREIESATEGKDPADIAGRVFELVGIVLMEKGVGAEEHQRYLSELSEAWEQGSL